MHKISGEISKNNYELIRDRVGLILFEELSYQGTISTDTTFETPSVFIGRVVAFDGAEMPAINVMISELNLSNDDVTQQDNLIRINVDIYTNSVFIQGEDKRGDVEAEIKLHRLAGVIRAILMNPVYKTLGFATPSIMRRSVKSAQFASLDGEDTMSQRFGRIVFEVECVEDVELQDVYDYSGTLTTAKFELTDVGYQVTKLLP